MKSKTVFVIGAGASKEAALPTGYELKDKIYQLLSFHLDQSQLLTGGDSVIWEALHRYSRQPDYGRKDINLYKDAALRISRAMPQAISKESVIRSEILIFLGFAFHRQNMVLIAGERNPIHHGSPRCYATAYKMSQSDRTEVSRQISEMFRAKAQMADRDLVCKDFFSEFWRSLAS